MEIVENNRENQILEFADFSFDLKEKILRRGLETISLPPKTCELLAFLLENHGRLLYKEEIFSKVWAETYVEEANLSHHIAVLRKALGEDIHSRKFIETVPRRGYRFVAPVRQISNDSIEITVKERTRTKTIINAEIESDEQFDSFENKHRLPAKNYAPPQFRQMFLGGAVVAVLAAISFFIYIYGFSQRRTEATSLAVKRLEITRVSDKNVSISVISPDGKFVAYAQNSNVAGGGGLYVRQLDTNREIILLEPNDERIFADIKFSFDGSLVYFIAFEKDTKIGAIYRISFLGGMRQKLVELKDNTSSFAVSPDNRQIVFFRYSPEGGTLVSVPIDNPAESEKVLLKFDRAEKDFDGFLSWSADGKFIALTGHEKDFAPNLKVYGFDVEKNELKPFSDEVFENIGKHVFSPDGREIFLIGDRQNTPQNFFAVDTKTGSLRTLPLEATSNSFYGFYGLSITADGKTLSADLTEVRANIWTVPINGDFKNVKLIKRGDNDGKRGLASLPNGYLLYTAVANGKSDIWKMKEDGTEIQPLTNNAFVERNLVVSKDGRFAVYSSDAGGGWHLFRLNLNEPGEVKQLTFGESIDRQPDISFDGDWIVYISEEKERSIIKKIPADGGDPIVLNDSENSVRPVFSPDGKQIAFVILSSARSQPGTIAIISANGGNPEKTYPVADFNFRDSTDPIQWLPDGKSIIFSKATTNISNIWHLNLKTSKVSPLTSFSDESIYNFAVSADGARIYLSRGIHLTNSVLIRNFLEK